MPKITSGSKISLGTKLGMQIYNVEIKSSNGDEDILELECVFVNSQGHLNYIMQSL